MTDVISMSDGRHVRNERETRQAFKGELSERGPAIAWCGERITTTDWFFRDAEHAALTLKYEGGIGVCSGCARELRDVFDREVVP